MDLDQVISDVHLNGINYHTREIYLHGSYDECYECDQEPGIEYRMASKFIKNLHILERKEKSNILVHLHTKGGVWNDGMAMFNAIRLSPCPITIVSYAQASSMSGVVLQAADKRFRDDPITIGQKKRIRVGCDIAAAAGQQNARIPV